MLLNGALVLGCLVTARASGAQAGTQTPIPQIVTQGRGEVEIAPNRAELILQVETRATDGGRAGEANAIVVRAILDTLRSGFRLTDAALSTVGYNLHPQFVYAEGQAPRVSGYVATNSVRVRTELLPRLGAMIDAAVRKGATGVSGLNFTSSNAEAARSRALTAAVQSAKRDADAMAAAAGGRIGALIELTSDLVEPMVPMFAKAMAVDAMRANVETPVEPGRQRVVAMVNARWRFIQP